MEKDKKKKKESLKKKIEAKIAGYRQEKEEYLEALKRERANLLNYKKAEQQRVEDRANKEKRRIIEKLLPIVDNFKRAKEEAKKGERKDEIVGGLLQIGEQIESFLREEGVEKIDCVGRDFDPHYHEALEMIHSDSLKSGLVAQEIEAGYILKGEIIRPAKVKVVK
jgi:molecular chaperone GrpE